MFENSKGKTIISRIKRSEFTCEFVKSSKDFKDYELNLYTTEKGKRYVLGSGHLGNGLTVWNYLEEKHNDYVTLAHIGRDRQVKFYDKDLPVEVKAAIEYMAKSDNRSKSVCQDESIFSSSPCFASEGE